jgi:hypothetical protein
MWIRPRRRAGRELVTDTDAFLSGRYAEQLAERADQVPPWAWLNLIAHGTHEELVAARPVRRRGGSLQLYSHWVAARSYLIGEVLGALDSGHEPLAEVQRRVLLPLETELSSPVSLVRYPRDLVLRVLAALEADAEERRRRQPW